MAAAVAGCGGGSKSPDAGGAADATPAPADHIEIDSPRDGAVVRATTSLPGSHRARLRVAGAATPNATITLSGGCDFQGCDSVARAGADGRWKGRVWVFAPAEKPSATVEASTATSAAPLARVHVRLRAARQVRATATPRVKRSQPGPTRTPQPVQPAQPTASATPAPTAPPTTSVRRFVLVGDSLAEGIEPLMAAQLPGWVVRSDALTSRPLAVGMRIVAGLDLSAPTVLAISLFTNDDPRNVGALEAAVRTSVQRVSPRGCAIWATIVRPPYNGVSYNGANVRLMALQRALGSRLLIVPWAQQVAQHPQLIGGDGVHGTPAGYRARAQMYAQAARACAG